MPFYFGSSVYGYDMKLFEGFHVSPCGNFWGSEPFNNKSVNNIKKTLWKNRIKNMTKKMIKFKFKSLSNNINYIKKYLPKVDSLFENAKDGEYYIKRKNNILEIYCVLNKQWYLKEKLKNYSNYLLKQEFKLFPNLSEKEWDDISKINKKYLSKDMKESLMAYNQYKYILNLIRETRKKFLKF